MLTKQDYIEKAQSLFDEGYACSQSVLLAFCTPVLIDEKVAKLIASGFGGGMGRLRQKCGALTGSFMVLGIAFGNIDPKDLEKKLNAYQKIQELNKMFEIEWGTSNCQEILDKFVCPDEIELRVHHQLICRKVVANTAAMLYDLIYVKKN